MITAAGPDGGRSAAAGSHVDPRWLQLRGPADAAARTDFTGPLAAELGRFLQHRLGRAGGRRIASLVDAGAGTGAGAAWIRPRLPVPQDWRLLDSDAALLAAAGPIREGWARPVVADIADLPALLAEQPADAVTCQAVLDLLTAHQIDTLLAPALAGGAAVLLSLTVTGRVDLTPTDPDDASVGEAFNAHQHRTGRLGPDAAAHAAAVLRRHDYLVTEVPAPWRLGADRAELTEAWLRGRAAAAAEQVPDSAERFDRWLLRRTSALHGGDLTASVGHVDVLGIPPPRPPTASALS